MDDEIKVEGVAPDPDGCRVTVSAPDLEQATGTRAAHLCQAAATRQLGRCGHSHLGGRWYENQDGTRVPKEHMLVPGALRPGGRWHQEHVYIASL